ncbi:13424_t:CDS:1, partial [Dentiscutata heterogama]
YITKNYEDFFHDQKISTSTKPQVSDSSNLKVNILTIGQDLNQNSKTEI